MTKCFFVPTDLLKDLKDHVSLKISKRIRARRAGIKNLLKTIFGKKGLVEEEINASQKIQVFNCQNTTELPGKLVINQGGAVKSYHDPDEIARKSHINSVKIYKFYKQFFNRESLDNKNCPLLSSVHYGNDYNNAFYNGTQMVFGDGNGKLFVSFAKSDDVTGHEFGHGLVDSTAKLIYLGDSGALNESFADILGISLKHYVRGMSDPRTANWLIGDDVVGPEFPGKSIRTFIPNEKAYKNDPQPSHIKQKYKGWSDNFGVHINSKINNIPFYILCLELNEPSYGKPLQIVYHTLLRLGKYSGFKTCAKTAYSVALELYGQTEADAVKKAYATVGL